MSSRPFVLAWLLAVTLQIAPAAAADRLPAIAMQRLDGTATTTAEWRGRPMVLNVWATWCAPCRSEMPALQRLADRLEGAGIGVAGLSVDQDANLVREFVLKYRIRFPIGIAAAPGEAMSALGAVGLPLTLYVDAEGRVVERVLGAREWDEEALVREIRKKLAPSLQRAGAAR